MQPRVKDATTCGTCTYHTWLHLSSSAIPRHEYVSERLSQRLMTISLSLPFALVSSSTISTHIKAAEKGIAVRKHIDGKWGSAPNATAVGSV